MELLDEESHRLLLWSVRLFEVGSVPTSEDLRRLAEPRVVAGGEIVNALAGNVTAFKENAAESLVRRGLVERSANDGLSPTELGCHVVNALGLHPEEPPLFEVIDSDLRSSDPLAFARMVGRIAALDRPMIVDPYCRRPELEYLTYHSSVTRVLVSDRLAAADLDELVDFVESISKRKSRLRVRVAPAAAIHDRHVVDDERVLQVGGVVRSGAGGTTIVTEPVDLGGSAIAYYRRAWKDAQKLVSYKPS